MEQFNNDDLEYVVGDYYDVPDFEDDDPPADSDPQNNGGFHSSDSDFEDDFETVYFL